MHEKLQVMTYLAPICSQTSPPCWQSNPHSQCLAWCVAFVNEFTKKHSIPFLKNRIKKLQQHQRRETTSIGPYQAVKSDFDTRYTITMNYCAWEYGAVPYSLHTLSLLQRFSSTIDFPSLTCTRLEEKCPKSKSDRTRSRRSDMLETSTQKSCDIPINFMLTL